MARDQTHASYQQRIMRVLTYVKQNLDEPLDLNQLAELAFFSPHHFHRIFKSIVGETVKEHVLRLKLQRALIELSMTQDSVTDIAFHAGFNSLEAFSRAIKLRYKMTPSQLRKESRSLIRDKAKGTDILEVNKVSLPKLDLAVCRHIGRYDDAALAWIKLVQLTSMQSVMQEDALRIGFAYDHPEITPEDKCCYDACIAWSDDYQEQGELSRIIIEPGEYAMFKYVGHLSGIDKAYMQFAKQAGFEQQFDFSERHNFMWYRNNAMLTNPDEQITECYFPLV